MRVKLSKDKVIDGSVWLVGSELDLPLTEATTLIDAEEAVEVDAAPKHASASDKPASSKKKKTEE